MSSNDNTSAEQYSTSSLFKFSCKVIRFICFEEFWYEAKSTGRYLLLSGYIFELSYLFVAYCNVVLEVIFNTLPKSQHKDAISFIATQGIIIVRFCYNSYRRTEAKELMKDLVDICREHEAEHIQRDQYKKFRFCFWAHLALVNFYVVFLLITGLRRYLSDEQPLIFVPAYWPKLEDDTFTGVLFKTFMFLYIFLIAIVCVAKDTLIILKLIVISYKFATLRYYFESLWKDFENKDLTIIELKHKCLKGIVMHRELLRIINFFSQLYDTVLSIHMTQGFVLVILLMLNLSTATEFFNIILPLIHMAIMVGQLGLFMWNAGEVTFQASLLPTAIFHCGWHLRPMNCEHSRDIRRIVLMGCLQAQRPVIFKAFGIQDVSYGSFVSVIQTSYSIFAVFRAK